VTATAPTIQPIRCSFAEFSARIEYLVDQISLPVAPPEDEHADEHEDHRPRRALALGSVPAVHCNACGRQVAWPDTRFMFVVGTVYDETSGEVHEYRDCRCGSTLLFVLEDRRDESEFGRQRRALFDQWLDRLAQRTARSPDDLRGLLRGVFRIAMNPHHLRRPRPSSGAGLPGEKVGHEGAHRERIEGLGDTRIVDRLEKPSGGGSEGATGHEHDPRLEVPPESSDLLV
jgi:hypothetical protein